MKFEKNIQKIIPALIYLFLLLNFIFYQKILVAQEQITPKSPVTPKVVEKTKELKDPAFDLLVIDPDFSTIGEKKEEAETLQDEILNYLDYLDEILTPKVPIAGPPIEPGEISGEPPSIPVMSKEAILVPIPPPATSITEPTIPPMEVIPTIPGPLEPAPDLGVDLPEPIPPEPGPPEPMPTEEPMLPQPMSMEPMPIGPIPTEIPTGPSGP